jgi:hypothetical protein
VSWVWDGISSNIGSVSCVVGNVTNSVGWSVCRGIGCRVSWSIGCSISSGIDLLHDFVFSSSLFSHGLKGTLAVVSAMRMFQSAPRIRTCCGSTISRASFFDLGRGDANVSLKASDRWRIFEVV